MLVSMKEMVEEAARNDYAIPAFNVFGYEDAISVIRAAEEVKAPVIFGVNLVAVKHMPLPYLAPILLQAAKDAKVPVVVHLDHGKDYASVEDAIRNSFSSVMFDGSQLPLEQNIEKTKEIVQLARKHGVSIEAEIGSVGYSDPSLQMKHQYTDPEEASQFAERTGVDAVAVSIGTVHRMEEQGAAIDYERLESIQRLVTTPLVLHGSTGVKDEDLKRLATYRFGKVNIGTALRMAFGRTMREEMLSNPQEFDRVKLFQKPMEAVRLAALSKYQILGFGRSRSV